MDGGVAVSRLPLFFEEYFVYLVRADIDFTRIRLV